MGGHITPISIDGDRLLWKNAQNKEKNKQTSETKNNIKPILRLLNTLLVWKPWNVDSLTMSFIHRKKTKVTKITPENSMGFWL